MGGRSRLTGEALSRTRRPLACVAAIATLAVACADGDSGSTGKTTGLLDPCGGPDHPCTLSEVSPEALSRTEALAELAMHLVASPDDLERAAAWLGEQDGVVSVATGPETLRFRVTGGRGRWIFLRPFASVATLGGPLIQKPPRRLDDSPSAGPHVTDLRAAVDVPSALPQDQSNPREKKALLLSPFRWQWEIQGEDDGLEEVRRILRARDYVDRVDLWTERLDPDNPACAVGAVHWEDCRTIGEMSTPSAYTTWQAYDFIVLMTHGGAAENDAGEVRTGVLTSWTVGDVNRERARVEAAGLDAAEDLIDRIGLEKGDVHIYGVTQEAVPRVGDGQIVQLDIPFQSIVDVEAEYGPVPLNPDLSADERPYCRRALEVTPDSRRVTDAWAEARLARQAAEEEEPDAVDQILSNLGLADEPDRPGSRTLQHEAMAQRNGKKCGDYPTRVRTGPFIMLTTPFFEATYPQGLNDAVVIMSACGVAFRNDLLQALDGDKTVVLGWTRTVALTAAAEAVKLIAKKLVEVDETVEDDSGLTVGQAMKAVRELLDAAAAAAPSESVCRDPPSADVQANCALQYGNPLTVVNSRPADRLTGAVLRVHGDTTVRAREIVYLVDDNGDELRDGAVLAAVGMAGDGRPDSVDLRIRLDGLRLEEDPVAPELHVMFEERRIDIDDQLHRRVADGVWELDYRLPFGRDHHSGETVDLEVVADLPDDKDSGWLYRDLRLTSCGFTAAVSAGPGAGNHAGPAQLVGRGLTLSDASAGWRLRVAVPAFEPGVYETEMMVVVDMPHPEHPEVTVEGIANLPDQSAPATLTIDRAEGDFGGGLGGVGRGEGTLEGRVVGRAGWRFPGGREVWFDVSAEFTAVKYRVSPRSNYQACREGWGLESTGDLMRELEAGDG